MLFSLPAGAAQTLLTIAALDRIDRETLAATLDGDVLRLEPHLAPGFRATVQVPTDQGYQTLTFNREQFLLYAWQARRAADGYRVRSQPARYRIAADGRSAIGTRVLDETLAWNGQPLRYSTERTTQYQPQDGGIRITGLEVRVIDWEAQDARP